VHYIEFEKIAETVESLCIAACHELSRDVVKALRKAAEKERNPLAKQVLQQLLENARIAKEQKLPLCQDTGMAVVFLEQGGEVAVKDTGEIDRSTIVDAVNEGVKRGYEKGYLRKSAVSEPLRDRKNTGTNTPAIVHHTIVPGRKLKVTVMAKGGGCENRSRFRMFRPTASRQEIIEWVLEVVKTAGADACPPFLVGVGIGGDFELCCMLSKKALLRQIGSRNGDEFYEELENELLDEINKLGIGPQGFGGDTTALEVFIETAPCHIASLPVAVNIECHSHRHKTAVI